MSAIVPGAAAQDKPKGFACPHHDRALLSLREPALTQKIDDLVFFGHTPRVSFAI